MDKYWENKAGYYDPTATKAIENEVARENKSRNKQVHDTIQEIKNILKIRDLELLSRIELKDRITEREYR